MHNGTDPEFFILDEEGKPKGAHHFFPGKEEKMETKSTDFKPEKDGFQGSGKGIKVFRDGYAVEFNPPGATCRQLFFSDVGTALVFAQSKLPKGHSLSTKPVVEIDLRELEDAPNDLLTFGCDPSWDAYSGREKRPEIDARSFPFRMSGGHMHFSTYLPYELPRGYYYPDSSPQKVRTPLGEEALANPSLYPDLIKLFDLYIGIPLTFLYPSPENFFRRKFYGQAGEFRPQKYPTPDGFPTVCKWVGVEYRTPSAELFNSKAVASMAFGVGRRVVADFPKLMKSWDKGKEHLIQNAINTGEGVEDLLPTMKHFYNPAVLKKVKAVLDEKKDPFTFLKDGEDEQPDARKRDSRGMFISGTRPGFKTGWGEFLVKHKLSKFNEVTYEYEVAA